MTDLTSVLLFFLCGLLSNAATASEVFRLTQDQWDQRSKYAVVVGVDEYRNTTPLEHAVNDARSLSETLMQSGYEVLKLENYQADPDVVLDALRRATTLIGDQAARADATLIFAFSGHGFQQDGSNYLAMGNTNPNRLHASALSMKRVKAVMKNSGIGQSVLFIDACRNSPTRSTAFANNAFAPDKDAKGLAILYSTGAGQLSWEDSTLKQGVFSHYLGKALQGQGAQGNQWITIDGLFGYVKRSVASHVFKKFNKEQVPYFAGERNGNFAIALNNPASAPKPYIADQADENVSAHPPTVHGKWANRFIAFGVIAAAAIILSASSDSESDKVTLVVPTP